MIELIYEYKQSLQDMKRLKETYTNIPEEERAPQDSQDITLINSMISEMEFVIRWLRKGREPEALRGFDRRDAYSRTLYYDSRVLDAHSEIAMQVHERNVEADEILDVDVLDNNQISDAISVLSEKERDVYLMNKAQQLSYTEIAELMGVKKTTVQNHVKRAEKKIKKRTEESLFLVV